MVSDYGVRPRDIMTIRLEHYGTWIGIDFYHVGRGDALSPLPSVGKVYFYGSFYLVLLYILIFLFLEPV